MNIPQQDSEVEYFLVELVMNYGICDAGKYFSIEKSFPAYFNEHGFIPYNEYLDSLFWMPDVKGFCAYILLLENGRTYKGYTEHFRDRMVNHFAGKGCATTAKWKPLYILHYEVLPTKADALKREKYFKTISGIDNIRKRVGVLNTILPPNKQ